MRSLVAGRPEQRPPPSTIAEAVAEKWERDRYGYLGCQRSDQNPDHVCSECGFAWKDDQGRQLRAGSRPNPYEDAATELERETERRRLVLTGSAEVDPAQGEVAILLAYLSEYWKRAGRQEKALPAITEAVAIFRRLHAADPASCPAGLVLALCAMAATFRTVGFFDSALAAGREAVEVCLQWQAGQREPSPYLETALEEVAEVLAAVGHQGEAARISEQARRIAAQQRWSRLSRVRGDAPLRPAWPFPLPPDTRKPRSR